MTASLKQNAARGAALTITVQLCRIVIQLAALIVLTRFLDPSVFGVMAIVLVVIGLGETLRELGLASASIHADHITPQQQSNLFWVNTAIGVVFAVVCVASIPLLESVYRSDDLGPALAATSAVFVLNGLASQHRAILARELRFTALALSELAAVVIGLVVAIAVATSGGGLAALVTQQLVQAAMLLVISVAASRWIPTLPRRAPMGEFFRFGGWLSLTQVINYGARNLDTLVLGRIVTATTLGYYNRAFQLVMLPVTQINAPATKVAFPILARLQDDPIRFRRYLGAGHRALMHSVVPLLFAAVTVCDPLLTLVLGAQWSPTVGLFVILAVAGIMQTAGYTFYWVFLATGRTAANFRYTVVSKGILVAAILVGAHWGVTGVATGFAAATAAGWVLGVFWLARITGIPRATWTAPVVVAAGVYVPACIAGYSAGHSVDQPIVRVIVAAGVFAAVYALSAALNPAFRRDLALLRDVGGSMRRVTT